MEMISDSAKQNWEYVIVWKLDRFARNRNDSAIMNSDLLCRRYGSHEAALQWIGHFGLWSYTEGR